MGSALCNEMRKNIKPPSEGRAREKQCFEGVCLLNRCLIGSLVILGNSRSRVDTVWDRERGRPDSRAVTALSLSCQCGWVDYTRQHNRRIQFIGVVAGLKLASQWTKWRLGITLDYTWLAESQNKCAAFWHECGNGVLIFLLILNEHTNETNLMCIYQKQ